MSYVYLLNQPSSELLLESSDVGIIVKDNGDILEVKFLREHNEHIINRSEIAFFNIFETGDDFDFKVCDRCFKLLSTSQDFENNRIKKGGKITKRPSCRKCRVQKNGVSVSTADRAFWNKSKPVEYSSFTCPICDKTTIAGISKVVLDHCHKTGNVRGWVCESCNTGIGRFDDDPNIVYKAIEWLLKD
jgi:hypothetical protein